MIDNNVRPSVIVFDVNETMIDMSPLKQKVNELLRNDKAFNIWFGMMLHHSLVDNCTNNYHDFSVIANATLGMAAKQLQQQVSDEEKKNALSIIKTLTVYSDVANGLELLQHAGYRLVTLTNSPMDTLTAQLHIADIKKYFEATLSIDAIKKYKPAPEAYQYAANELKVPTTNMMMVAAHGWDIAGAINAGMKTAFIEREGQSLYPLASAPDFMGNDLLAVAKAIINQYNKHDE